MELNEIQKASVEHILKVFEDKKSVSINTTIGNDRCYLVKPPPPFPPRYLLADEVGLGKTITTAGVINQLAYEKEKKEPEKPFNVYYICGNERITNQNKKRLEECCGISNGLSNVRLTMQKPPTGKDKKIRIFPITPAVAFTSKNSQFHEKEFETICQIYEDYVNTIPTKVKCAMEQIKSLWVEKDNAKGDEVLNLPTPSQLLSKITGTLRDPQLNLGLKDFLLSVKKVLLSGEVLLTDKMDMSKQVEKMDNLIDVLEFSVTLNKIQELQDKYSEQEKLLQHINLMFTNNFDRVTELHRQFQILRKHAFHLQVTELNPPDLIVLDEFQNYSELIEVYRCGKTEDESTPKQGDKLCYPRFNLMMDSAPVLLLSATPFDVVSKDVHDTDEYETQVQSQEQDEQEDDEQEDDKDEDFIPAEGLKSTEDSFASVFRFITGVDYDPDKTIDHKNPKWLYKNMFCRTQRSNFYEEKQDSMIVERFPTMKQTVAHMKYNKQLLGSAKKSPEYPLLSPKNMLEESEATLLEEMTYATLDPLLQTSMSDSQKLNWVKISPAFVNFSSWYKSIFQDVEQKDFQYTPTMLSDKNHQKWKKCINHGEALADSLALGAKGHAGYEFLKETVLPEGVEDMLWIPPVISHSMAYQNDKNPFWKNKDYSKTLVFTKYRMSTQSLAYFMCQEREKRCEIDKQNSTEFEVPENLPDGYFKRAVATIPSTNDTLKKFLIDLFNDNMPLIQRVTGKSGIDAVNKYAQMGGLMAVIEEYLFVAGEKACPIGESSQVTVLLDKEKMFDGNDPKKTIKPDLGFAERFTADLGDVKGNRRTEESNLKDRFNSPFFPFMMTATSTAQEGLDFHNYSHNMLHFSMPETPVVFRQREGRIDRRRSHLMRKRLLALLTTPNPPSMNGFYKKAYKLQNMPENPVVFRQRRGRIDRRRSHLIRKRLLALLTTPNPPSMNGLYKKAYKLQNLPETPVVFRKRKGRIDRRRSHLMRKRLRAFLTPPPPPSMNGLYKKAYKLQKVKYHQNPLFPDWYVPDVPKKQEQIRYSRQVWAMPASIEKSHFQKMKVAQKKYDTFLGDSFFSGGTSKDNENAFCPFLQQKNKTP